MPCAMNEVANEDKDEEVWLHKTSNSTLLKVIATYSKVLVSLAG